MPSTSKKQHNFMEAVAHSPAFAKKAGVPQSVGRDFSNADKGRKFSKGGDVMATKSTDNGMNRTMAKVKTAAPSRDGIAQKGKTRGKQLGIDGPKRPGKPNKR
jgi:hypothetical protein